jgi:hypothetical protein
MAFPASCARAFYKALGTAPGTDLRAVFAPRTPDPCGQAATPLRSSYPPSTLSSHTMEPEFGCEQKQSTEPQLCGAGCGFWG